MAENSTFSKGIMLYIVGKEISRRFIFSMEMGSENQYFGCFFGIFATCHNRCHMAENSTFSKEAITYIVGNEKFVIISYCLWRGGLKIKYNQVLAFVHSTNASMSYSICWKPAKEYKIKIHWFFGKPGHGRGFLF